MAARNLCTIYCRENHDLMAHQEGSAKKMRGPQHPKQPLWFYSTEGAQRGPPLERLPNDSVKTPAKTPNDSPTTVNDSVNDSPTTPPQKTTRPARSCEPPSLSRKSPYLLSALEGAPPQYVVTAGPPAHPIGGCGGARHANRAAAGRCLSASLFRESAICEPKAVSRGPCIPSRHARACVLIDFIIPWMVRIIFIHLESRFFAYATCFVGSDELIPTRVGRSASTVQSWPIAPIDYPNHAE